MTSITDFRVYWRWSFWFAIFYLLLPHAESALAQQAARQTPSAAIELTAAERAWLAGNHTVRARVADYPPYMLTKPTPSGIAVDYLSAIANRFGFKVEFLPDSLGFPASVNDVSGARQHYDLLLTFTRTPEREKQFAITADYLTAPWVIYARQNSPYIIGLESLGGRSIAAEKGFVITNKIKSDYPAIRIVEVSKSEDALLAVATGQADAYVGNLANASYLIKANRLDNLVVTAPTIYGINTQAMAVRNDWPELAGLINKGIAAMTAEERNAISQKWSTAEFRMRIDYTLIWQIVAISTLIFLAFLYWNRKLSREVALRTQAEKSVRESAAQLAVERDQLEQRVVERTARLSEALEFNETMLLSSPLPMGVYAESGQCVMANEAFAKFVGATREELLAQNFKEIPSWQRTTLLDDCLAALKLSTLQQREAHTVSSFGKDVWFEYRILPLYLKGQDHLLIQFFDLTERKQAETELIQHRNHLEELVAARTSELAQSRDAAEAGNRAKTIFLANMSHELRTPMNGVMGMIDLVLRRATDPKQIDWLNKCKGAAQRMVNVINDIIDFSKAEADRLPLDEKSFSLRQLIDDAMAMQDITAQAKDLSLVREIPANFPDQLSGDSFRLRQILLNFLGNACKFSEQGTITVRVNAVEQDGDNVLARIEVEDEGIGISPENQAMLFQAFTQVDGSMARKYSGSGLGLAISRRLATLMGGDVGMVSQEGRGSTFWATVRLKSVKASEVAI